MCDWQRFRLGELARFHRGVTWSKNQELDEAEPEAVPVLRIPNIQHKLDTSNLIWLRSVSKSAVRQCAAAKDWVLMVGSNGNPDRVGNCVLIREPTEFLFASFLVGIEPVHREEISPEFLFRILSGPEVQRYITDDVQGSTGLNNINLNRLKAKVVVCPDLTQQQRIAEILSTVDEAIEHTETLIAKTQQIKAGLMHDLFTRGITPDGQIRPPRKEAPQLYKKSPLGWIPKEWKAEKLGDILSRWGGHLQTGPFGSQLHAHEYQAEGVPIVMPKDINNGQITINDIARISESRAQKLFRHRMQYGDIVISRRGELSRAAAISANEEGWVCGTGCFLLRLRKSVLRPEFASYVYRQNFVQRQIAGRAVGTTMPSLNNSVMVELLFLFCDEDEQFRIVSILQAVEQEIAELTQGARVAHQLKTGLMHDLLTGRVRVPVTDATEPKKAAANV